MSSFSAKEKLLITGATGSIGSAVLKYAILGDYDVYVMTRHNTLKENLMKYGVKVIIGNLSFSGEWQNIVKKAHYIIHVAQPDLPKNYNFLNISRKKILIYSQNRCKIDANLIESTHFDNIKKIIYVAGTSIYGDQGTTLVDENAIQNSIYAKICLEQPLENVERYIKQGFPIITSFPGKIYDPKGWFATIIKNIDAYKNVGGLKHAMNKCMSFMHFEDCARAMLHLLKHGKIGENYFLVDDKPATRFEMIEEAAKALHKKYKMLFLPSWVLRLLLGPIIFESFIDEQRLSNAKLKQTGFKLLYPTIETGIPDVVRQWKNM